MKNEMTLAFDSISENEEFARVTVAAFASQLNPTLEEVADIRTAVSEAVTNAIIHGYPEGIHTIVLRVRMENQQLEVWVRASALQIFPELWNHSIPAVRIWSVPAWALCSWKHLWTR